jgi:hypothetical protein
LLVQSARHPTSRRIFSRFVEASPTSRRILSLRRGKPDFAPVIRWRFAGASHAQLLNSRQSSRA